MHDDLLVKLYGYRQQVVWRQEGAWGADLVWSIFESYLTTHPDVLGHWAEVPVLICLNLSGSPQTNYELCVNKMLLVLGQDGA